MMKQLSGRIPYARGIVALMLSVLSYNVEIQSEAAKLEVVPTPAQSVQARETILDWMECEECHSGELEAVVRLGSIVVPSLIACLVDGPSQANQEIMRRHLVGSYSHLKQYAIANPGYNVTRSETEYVEHYQAKYVARYQIRAAKALAKIGGAEAKRAIEDVLRTPLSKGVAKAIGDSLKNFKEPSQ